jgi:hypothetical protein
MIDQLMTNRLDITTSGWLHDGRNCCPEWHTVLEVAVEDLLEQG